MIVPMLSLALYATACLCDNKCMIATLSGRVSEKLQEQVVLDVGGVGYGLLVTAEDYGILSAGKTTKLYVTTATICLVLPILILKNCLNCYSVLTG